MEPEPEPVETEGGRGQRRVRDRLFCASPQVVPGCTGAGCCTSFCDLSDPEPSADCGGVAGGQECVSAFEEGQALPGLEDVGVCAIPD